MVEIEPTERFCPRVACRIADLCVAGQRRGKAGRGSHGLALPVRIAPR